MPEHQIMVELAGTWGKTRDKDTGSTDGQTLMDCPRWRPFALGKKIHPCAVHILKADGGGIPVGLRPKVKDVFAVDLIGTQDARIYPVGKALVGFLDRTHDAERRI